LVEILKQDQYRPLTVEKQITVIFVGAEGYLDKLPVGVVKQFEKEFLEFVDNKYSLLLKKIAEEKALSDELKENMRKVVTEFLEIFKVEV
jgi:F-type H+-transporting ATPase subunit alpha